MHRLSKYENSKIFTKPAVRAAGWSGLLLVRADHAAPHPGPRTQPDLGRCFLADIHHRIRLGRKSYGRRILMGKEIGNAERGASVLGRVAAGATLDVGAVAGSGTGDTRPRHWSGLHRPAHLRRRDRRAQATRETQRHLPDRTLPRHSLRLLHRPLHVLRELRLRLPTDTFYLHHIFLVLS
ncbi:unnamed protein product [Nezara viridula]|uniref:Uncharacterized protein n=1 Tax=Nezara viridula TaxID=85310 RepID=A0A9P0MFZ9_NEZVI|nr:unnamed protein product [Nezara viridula]